MGSYRYPSPVKLVIGFLTGNLDLLQSTRKVLEESYGPEEEVMEPIPFPFTSYYEKELGPVQFRSFVSYETLVGRESIVDVKRFTNKMEEELAAEGRRPLNLDPGYLTLGQFFLATTKDQRHRIYVRDGIFMETTLYFFQGRFHAFEWTYPDYRSTEYHEFFLRARGKLAFHQRKGHPFSMRDKMVAKEKKENLRPGRNPGQEAI